MAKDGLKSEDRSRMSSSEEEHSLALGEEMVSCKSRWSALKRMRGGMASPVQQTSLARMGDQSYDEGMWDNNDDVFLQEVAHQRRHNQHSPNHSDNTLEEVASLADFSPQFSSNHSLSNACASWSTRSKRPTSAAGGSLLTNGSLSASASDASTALTLPSPRSSKMDASSRHRLSGHRFSDSNEVSPTGTSFSSQEARQRTHSSEKLQDGWTEEAVSLSTSRGEEHGGIASADIYLTSLPEEQSPDQWSSHPFRRPSNGSDQFMSSSFVTPSKKTLKATARQLEYGPSTDYGQEKTPMTAKSSTFSSPKSAKGSPTPTKKTTGLVSGLKKRLGNTLRSTGAQKESAKVDSDPRDSGASDLATEEVHIVNAESMSRLDSAPDSPSLGQLAARSIIEANRRAHPTGYESGPAERRTEDGYRSGGTMAKDRIKSPSVESFTNRIFNNKRSSGLFSHSRNSSRTSIIEHTSFEEARRGSGVFSGAGSMSSQHNLSHSLQSDRQPFAPNEEEREELKGDNSPMGHSWDLPPVQSGLLRSPVRPERLMDSSTSAHRPSRASLESSFNAAHDRRWSAVGPSFQSERRGSDAGTSVSVSQRWGSDVGHPQGSMPSRKGQAGEFGQRDSMSSTRSKRSSWQRNISVDALVPGRQSPITRSKASRRSLTTSQRWSDMVLPTMGPRKQSLSSAQISRPTSIVGAGSSIDVADGFAEDYSQATSSTELVAQRFRAQQQQEEQMERRMAVQSPAHAFQQASRYLYERQSRSAGGRVEYPGSQGVDDGGEEPSVFFEQQQQQPVAPKRPTFGLDLQPDAAAAFDCIPSPQSRRPRTASTPTLLGLSISGLRAVGEAASSGSALVIDGQEEEEGQEELLMASGDSDKGGPRLFGDRDGTTAVSLPLCSPRPMPTDAPRSPVFDELELLADDASLLSASDSDTDPDPAVSSSKSSISRQDPSTDAFTFPARNGDPDSSWRRQHHRGSSAGAVASARLSTKSSASSHRSSYSFL